MDLARINEDGLLELINSSTYKNENIALLKDSGFLEFVPSNPPQVEKGYTAVDSFEVKDGKLYQSWEIKPDKETIKQKIETLKKQLGETDYQIIKCYEASLMGEKLPYDVETVHTERQNARDEINRLEKDL